MKKQRAFLIISLLLSASLSYAAAGWPRARELEHRKLAMTEAEFQKYLTKNTNAPISIVELPVGIGYDQGSTGLCWFYATMNAIESSILAAEPNAKPAFSRNIMQSITHEDRYVRQIKGIENNLEEGGTAVDAITLLRGEGYAKRSGLYHFADWLAQPHAYMYDPLRFSGTGTEEEQIAQLNVRLAQSYPPSPALTHDMNDNAIQPQELQKQILGSQKWRAYGIATQQNPDGVEAAHFDVGYARAGTKALYLNQQHIGEMIYKALTSGHGLTVTWRGHDEAVYGAIFDSNNQPTVLYIKGSYQPTFTYKMEMPRVFQQAIGFSTVAVE